MHLLLEGGGQGCIQTTLSLKTTHTKKDLLRRGNLFESIIIPYLCMKNKDHNVWTIFVSLLKIKSKQHGMKEIWIK